MSQHHHHHDHSEPIAISATAARVVVGLLTGIGVIVVIGVVWLWPSHQHVAIPLPMQNGSAGGAVHTDAGTVVMQDTGPCNSPSNGKVFPDTPQPPPNSSFICGRSLVSITSGPNKGNHTLLEIPPGPDQPKLHVGDHIRLDRQVDPTGQVMYQFEDFARGLPLILIGIVFLVVIGVVARWRGIRAALGLIFAFAVLVFFLLPALLDGQPGMPTALVAGAVILYAVLYLAHGVNLRTSSALIGTLSALVLAAVLSWLALKVTHVTGMSEEQNTDVAVYVQHVSITGLLMAGFIIGSLGVLNDVTITQASTAFELAAIDEHASRRQIFAAAMRVGRDHIASTVYTLVLAYAGGALPLLLLFSMAGRSMRDVLTSDSVAIEIVRSAVGGSCLALSVPLTTVIAVLLARPPRLSTEPAAPLRPKRPDRLARSDRETSRPARRPVDTGAQKRVPRLRSTGETNTGGWPIASDPDEVSTGRGRSRREPDPHDHPADAHDHPADAANASYATDQYPIVNRGARTHPSGPTSGAIPRNPALPTPRRRRPAPTEDPAPRRSTPDEEPADGPLRWDPDTGSFTRRPK